MYRYLYFWLVLQNTSCTRPDSNRVKIELYCTTVLSDLQCVMLTGLGWWRERCLQYPKTSRGTWHKLLKFAFDKKDVNSLFFFLFHYENYCFELEFTDSETNPCILLNPNPDLCCCWIRIRSGSRPRFSFTKLQCCGSWFLPIPDPRSKTATKENEKKNFSYLFCSHKFHKIENYWIF